MGGQACVLYGAAEFSRDTDFAILAASSNLKRLQNALDTLKAECIAIPPFELKFLKKGHSIHFRCHRSDVKGMRVDIMTKMRGVASFQKLWKRRTTIWNRNQSYELLSVIDLVHSKKTQRDKDWPMIRRLVEAHYFQNLEHPTTHQILFWLSELRTPEILIDLAQNYPKELKRIIPQRSLLKFAQRKKLESLSKALRKEENLERKEDQKYWKPLKKDLEKLRSERLRKLKMTPTSVTL